MLLLLLHMANAPAMHLLEMQLSPGNRVPRREVRAVGAPPGHPNTSSWWPCFSWQVDGDIPPRVKKDAHELILDFIRSRPPLKQVPAVHFLLWILWGLLLSVTNLGGVFITSTS